VLCLCHILVYLLCLLTYCPILLLARTRTHTRDSRTVGHPENHIRWLYSEMML